MKTLRNLCGAVILIMALSITSIAGEITTWVVSPPPPPPASATATEAINSPNVRAQNVIDSETLLIKLTLNLLRLLSVV